MKLKRRLLEWEVVALVDKIGGFPTKLDDDIAISTSFAPVIPELDDFKDPSKQNTPFNCRPVTPNGFIGSGSISHYLLIYVYIIFLDDSRTTQQEMPFT